MNIKEVTESELNEMKKNGLVQTFEGVPGFVQTLKGVPMIKIDGNNYGQVGEVKYIKMTVDKFKEKFNNPDEINVSDGKVLNIDELSDLGVIASVPLHINNKTLGNYEAVCESGIEIW